MFVESSQEKSTHLHCIDFKNMYDFFEVFMLSISKPS